MRVFRLQRAFPSDKQSTSANASLVDAPRTIGEVVARRQSERQSVDESVGSARHERWINFNSPICLFGFQFPTCQPVFETFASLHEERSLEGLPAAGSTTRRPTPDDVFQQEGPQR